MLLSRDGRTHPFAAARAPPDHAAPRAPPAHAAVRYSVQGARGWTRGRDREDSNTVASRGSLGGGIDNGEMAVRPFSIEVSQEVLADLGDRLARTRWPGGSSLATLDGDGTGLAINWLRGLLEYWRDGFDWRAQERALNELPQVCVDVAGQIVHAVYVPGRGPDPLPLLLCHGWPSSFVEFTKVIPQ